MSNEQSTGLDAQRFASWYQEFSERLKGFLFGLLRDHHATEEVLQATFAKALAQGGVVQPGSEKAWLFQVAFREAAAWRRRQGQERRSQEVLRFKLGESPAADVELLRWETVQQVREALEGLPSEQREVVVLRIHEEQTFQEISNRLQIPLGTVLTRMRLALQKLYRALQNKQND